MNVFGGGSALGPRLRDRVAHALRPGWARSVMIRRSAALLLVAVAVVVGVTGQRAKNDAPVLVAARDLLPGHTVTGTDLRELRIPVDLVPDGALRLTADSESHTVTGPVRAGEIVTESRLLSPRLPMELTGRADARLVPVRLADDTVASLLRAGDLVDVLNAQAQILAAGAIVALVPGAGPTTPTRATSNPPILLAMTETAAHRVAGAGLDVPLAVVLH
ncbi:SAF domain-containing protein [Gordonia polyisoprenivorans]|uniref:SAF domain-containing protein n=1 Tax=Gordonia polyisoprenivorans TaxID=84595 RepID=UPI0003604B67|nr:SAF domain-containing protein [Gordonia polyisoprenivorans]